MTGSGELTVVPDHERVEWIDQVYGVFGHPTISSDSTLREFLRGVFVDGHLIGSRGSTGFMATAAAVGVHLTLPGGAQVPASCLTGITVDATARGGGLLREMMTNLHRHSAEVGAPITILNPSQWPLYERFGYGAAAWLESITVDVTATRLRDDAPGGSTGVRRTAGPEAKALAQNLFEREAATIPGELIPPSAYWDRFTHDPAYTEADAILSLASNEPSLRRCVAVAERGLMAYRLRPDLSTESAVGFTVEVTDLIAVDTDTEAALWRHLYTMDLASQIVVRRVSIEHPLRWWVTDPRRARIRRHDGLWLRPLDVIELLTTRGWMGSGALTLCVRDAEGYAAGTYSLDVQAGSATCTRIQTCGEADLEMDVSALGALALGGTSARALALGGRIHTKDLRFAQLWDALATPERAPFSSYSL